jgi:hypothetical protein
MKLTTLFLVATITVFVGARQVYADAIFLSDGRLISTDIDGNQGLPEPPAEYHFHQTSVPTFPYSDFDASMSAPLCPCSSGSSQNSQLSGLNFASSLATSGGFGGGFWIISFQMKSVFNIVFELTSFYEFQTLAQAVMLQGGDPFTGSANMIYHLTGPSGDVFRYIGLDGIPGHPDNFQASGLLPPGTYSLYGESRIQGSTYKFETYRGMANLDFSMALTPVPEANFPLWLLALLASILLLWSRVKVLPMYGARGRRVPRV